MTDEQRTQALKAIDDLRYHIEERDAITAQHFLDVVVQAVRPLRDEWED
jgi:hypothetical protein